MKKLILLFFVSIAFQGCVHVVPLKGKYQVGSVKAKIDKPFDQVWEKAIDLIAETGLSVRLVDKSSGLIIADAASFFGLITIEDRKGKIISPNAYIVSEHVNPEYEGDVKVYDATAVWNMRIKEISVGVSTVSVNLHTIKVNKLSTKLHGESTGTFEKSVLDKIIGM